MSNPNVDPVLAKAIQARDLLKTQGVQIPDNIVQEFLDVALVESSRNHFNPDGTVKLGPRTRTGDRAIGFSQIMPATAKGVNPNLDPFKEIENIALGMQYYYSNDPADPIARRIAYMGGERSPALRFYKRTGQVPNWKLYSYLPNNNETFQTYVEKTGGFRAPKEVALPQSAPEQLPIDFDVQMTEAPKPLLPQPETPGFAPIAPMDMVDSQRRGVRAMSNPNIILPTPVEREPVDLSAPLPEAFENQLLLPSEEIPNYDFDAMLQERRDMVAPPPVAPTPAAGQTPSGPQRIIQTTDGLYYRLAPNQSGLEKGDARYEIFQRNSPDVYDPTDPRGKDTYIKTGDGQFGKEADILGDRQAERDSLPAWQKWASNIPNTQKGKALRPGNITYSIQAGKDWADGAAAWLNWNGLSTITAEDVRKNAKLFTNRKDDGPVGLSQISDATIKTFVDIEARKRKEFADISVKSVRETGNTPDIPTDAPEWQRNAIENLRIQRVDPRFARAMAKTTKLRDISNIARLELEDRIRKATSAEIKVANATKPKSLGPIKNADKLSRDYAVWIGLPTALRNKAIQAIAGEKGGMFDPKDVDKDLKEIADTYNKMFEEERVFQKNNRLLSAVGFGGAIGGQLMRINPTTDEVAEGVQLKLRSTVGEKARESYVKRGAQAGAIETGLRREIGNTAFVVAGGIRALRAVGLPVPGEWQADLAKVGQRQLAFEEGYNKEGGGKTWGGFLVKETAAAPIMVARIAAIQKVANLVTAPMGPAAAILSPAIAFSVDSALLTAGQGAQMDDIGIAAAKGFALGGLFGTAGRVVEGLEMSILKKNIPNLFVREGSKLQLRSYDDMARLAAVSSTIDKGLINSYVKMMSMGRQINPKTSRPFTPEEFQNWFKQEFWSKLTNTDIRAIMKNGGIPEARRHYYLTRVIGEGTRVGMIGPGTFAIEKAFGSSNEQAGVAAGNMILFHVVDELFRKGYKGAKAGGSYLAGKLWKIGDKKYSIDEKGGVFEHPPETPDRYVDGTIVPPKAIPEKLIGPPKPTDLKGPDVQGPRPDDQGPGPDESGAGTPPPAPPAGGAPPAPPTPPAPSSKKKKGAGTTPDADVPPVGDTAPPPGEAPPAPPKTTKKKAAPKPPTGDLVVRDVNGKTQRGRVITDADGNKTLVTGSGKNRKVEPFDETGDWKRVELPPVKLDDVLETDANGNYKPLDVPKEDTPITERDPNSKVDDYAEQARIIERRKRAINNDIAEANKLRDALKSGKPMSPKEWSGAVQDNLRMRQREREQIQKEIADIEKQLNQGKGKRASAKKKGKTGGLTLMSGLDDAGDVRIRLAELKKQLKDVDADISKLQRIAKDPKSMTPEEARMFTERRLAALDAAIKDGVDGIAKQEKNIGRLRAEAEAEIARGYERKPVPYRDEVEITGKSKDAEEIAAEKEIEKRDKELQAKQEAAKQRREEAADGAALRTLEEQVQKGKGEIPQPGDTVQRGKAVGIVEPDGRVRYESPYAEGVEMFDVNTEGWSVVKKKEQPKAEEVEVAPDEEPAPRPSGRTIDQLTTDIERISAQLKDKFNKPTPGERAELRAEKARLEAERAKLVAAAKKKAEETATTEETKPAAPQEKAPEKKAPKEKPAKPTAKTDKSFVERALAAVGKLAEEGKLDPEDMNQVGDVFRRLLDAHGKSVGFADEGATVRGLVEGLDSIRAKAEEGKTSDIELTEPTPEEQSQVIEELQARLAEIRAALQMPSRLTPAEATELRSERLRVMNAIRDLGVIPAKTPAPIKRVKTKPERISLEPVIFTRAELLFGDGFTRDEVRAKIQEEYNYDLTDAQLDRLSEQPPIGDTGQTPYFFRKFPDLMRQLAELVLPSMAKDVNSTNPLISEIARKAVLDAMARTINIRRSSQMRNRDWERVILELDRRGASEDLLIGMIEGLHWQTSWAKSMRELMKRSEVADAIQMLGRLEAEGVKMTPIQFLTFKIKDLAGMVGKDLAGEAHIVRSKLRDAIQDYQFFNRAGDAQPQISTSSGAKALRTELEGRIIPKFVDTDIKRIAEGLKAQGREVDISAFKAGDDPYVHDDGDVPFNLLSYTPLDDAGKTTAAATSGRLDVREQAEKMLEVRGLLTVIKRGTNIENKAPKTIKALMKGAAYEVKDGAIFVNKEALALWAGGVANLKVSGAYMTYNAAISYAAGLAVLGKAFRDKGLIAEGNKAIGMSEAFRLTAERHGDVVLSIDDPAFPIMSKVSKQEEFLHRADLRTRFGTGIVQEQLRRKWTPAEANKMMSNPAVQKAMRGLSGLYKKFDKEGKLAEVIAKALRDDGATELKITPEERLDIINEYVNHLAARGVDANQIKDAFKDISLTGDELIKIYEQRTGRKDIGTSGGAGAETTTGGTEGTTDVRGGGAEGGAPTGDGQPPAGGSRGPQADPSKGEKQVSQPIPELGYRGYQRIERDGKQFLRSENNPEYEVPVEWLDMLAKARGLTAKYVEQAAYMSLFRKNDKGFVDSNGNVIPPLKKIYKGATYIFDGDYATDLQKRVESGTEGLWGVFSMTRSLMSSGDISTIGRQGWRLVVGGRRWTKELTEEGEKALAAGQPIKRHSPLTTAKNIVNKALGRPVEKTMYRTVRHDLLGTMIYNAFGAWRKGFYQDFKQKLWDDPFYGAARSWGLDLGSGVKPSKGDVVHDGFRVGEIVEVRNEVTGDKETLVKMRTGNGPDDILLEPVTPKWEVFESHRDSATAERYPSMFLSEAPMPWEGPHDSRAKRVGKESKALEEFRLASTESGSITQAMRKRNAYIADLIANKNWGELRGISARELRRTLSWAVRGSQRSFDASLVAIRMKQAKALYEHYRVEALLEGKSIADVQKNTENAIKVINLMTGFVTNPFGMKEENVPLANQILFSARLGGSQLRMLNPLFWAKLPAKVKKEGVVALSRTAGVIGTMLTTAAFMNTVFPNANIQVIYDDPTDPGLMRFRFGKYSVDFSSGSLQWMTYLYKMARVTKDYALLDPFERTAKGYKDPNLWSSLVGTTGRQIRKKLAPIPGGFVSWTTGETVMGEPTNFSTEFANLWAPITWREFAKNAEEDGNLAALMFATEFFGFGTSRLKKPADYLRDIQELQKDGEFYRNAPGEWMRYMKSKQEMYKYAVQEERRRAKATFERENGQRGLIPTLKDLADEYYFPLWQDLDEVPTIDEMDSVPMPSLPGSQ